MFRVSKDLDSEAAFTYPNQLETGRERLEAFKFRQQADINLANSSAARLRRFHERYTEDEHQDGTYDLTPEESGEEAWKTSEGDRLKDFGVDEDVEFYDEDDIPLAQLLAGKKA